MALYTVNQSCYSNQSGELAGISIQIKFYTIWIRKAVGTVEILKC